MEHHINFFSYSLEHSSALLLHIGHAFEFFRHLLWGSRFEVSSSKSVSFESGLASGSLVLIKLSLSILTSGWEEQKSGVSSHFKVFAQGLGGVVCAIDLANVQISG